MTATWRRQEPEVMPLVLYSGEDFTRILTFDGPGDIPSGSSITLLLFDSLNTDATELGSWPAAISGAEAKWSVDHVTADAIPLEAAGGYRLMMTVPNPGTPSNPTIERCLALGKLTRK